MLEYFTPESKVRTWNIFALILTYIDVLPEYLAVSKSNGSTSVQSSSVDFLRDSVFMKVSRRVTSLILV